MGMMSKALRISAVHWEQRIPWYPRKRARSSKTAAKRIPWRLRERARAGSALPEAWQRQVISITIPACIAAPLLAEEP